MEMKEKQSSVKGEKIPSSPRYLIEKEKKVFLSAPGYACVEKETGEVIGAARLLNLLGQSLVLSNKPSPNYVA